MAGLNAVYDLSCSPPTFDFIGFLLSAEAHRIKTGRDKINLYIVPGKANGFRVDNLPPRDPAERRRMLDNIVIPMCELLPSCSTIVECSEQDVKADFPVGWSATNRISHYGTQHMINAMRDTDYPLTANITEKKDLITITIRNASYWPSRNSNKIAWFDLADRLSSFSDFIIINDGDLQRSYDRAVVYEGAKLNLFVGSGPYCLASAMKNANCLAFKMCSPNAVCCDEDFFKRQGFPVGSQLGRSNHRIVWADDDFDTLLYETLKELNGKYN